jgi:hypothetical protein
MAAAFVTGQRVAIGDHDTLTDLSNDSPDDAAKDSKHAWDDASKLSSTVTAE